MIKAADAYPHLPTITSLIYNGTNPYCNCGYNNIYNNCGGCNC